MADVTETQLPGVGVRHSFTTTSGERVAVLSHRTGRREVAIYDRSDPDACSAVLHLSPDDTRTLSGLLGGGAVGEAVAGVQQLEGVVIDWIRIRPHARHAGRTIGEGRFRTLTGASVVAIVRGAVTLPAPGPEVALEGADTVVAVGTPDGLHRLRDLLEA